MPRLFDYYIFADYSGSQHPQGQKNSIALAVFDGESYLDIPVKGYTRQTLYHTVLKLLLDLEQQGKRAILGFDHQYSFPAGLFEILAGRGWQSWDELLDFITANATKTHQATNPKDWAAAANQLISERCGTSSGPFWGPGFAAQPTDPKFPFAKTSLNERRLVEERSPSMKPLFKLGGHGSVGLQSLCGIPYLAALRSACREANIELFCWPFDGWELPESGHVLVEVYPRLCNSGKKSDEADAKETAKWLAGQDAAGTISDWFNPELTDMERARASLEGWVIGMR